MDTSPAARDALDLGKRGEFADALVGIDLVLANQAVSSENWATGTYLRGRFLDKLGRKDEAIATYTALVARKDTPAKDRARALFSRSLLLVELEHSEAIASYQELIDLHEAPSVMRCKAPFNRGNTLGRAGRVEEALADYESLIQDPEAPADSRAMALISQANELRASNRYSEMVACCERVISMEDAPVEQKGFALRHLADFQRDKDQFEAALDTYQRAIILDGLDAHFLALCLNDMAHLLVQMGRAAEAIPLCDRTLTLDTLEDDDYATALNNKGYALLQLGIGDEAACYRQALAYDDVTLEERIRSITCLLLATKSDAEASRLLDELRELARDYSDDETVQWALGMALGEYASTRSASPEEAWALYKELEEVARPFRTIPKWRKVNAQLSECGL